jgi:hypothetical protein
MGLLFGETQIYRLDQANGWFFPVQYKTEKFEGRIDSEKNVHEDFNNYLTSLNPLPSIFELIYIQKPALYIENKGNYETVINSGLQGVQPTIEPTWVNRPLPNRKLNWLLWNVDEQGNKIKEFGYFFYFPKTY